MRWKIWEEVIIKAKDKIWFLYVLVIGIRMLNEYNKKRQEDQMNISKKYLWRR